MEKIEKDLLITLLTLILEFLNNDKPISAASEIEKLIKNLKG